MHWSQWTFLDIVFVVIVLVSTIFALRKGLAREVISVETHTSLALAAQERLTDLGYANVHIHGGDGSLGFADAAPYDAILVAAAAPEIPPLLVDQLREGGRLVIPVGSEQSQELLQTRKKGGVLRSRALFECVFVPLLGRYGWR